MKKLKRVLVTAFAAMMLFGCIMPSGAMAARTIGDFYFYLTNDNENDQTGLFNATSPVWIAKQTRGIKAAISCDSYSNSSYNLKATLNYDNPTRATSFEWLVSNTRVEPTYLANYGLAGQSYKLWARRDDRETVNGTTATGTWSPDNA